MVIAWKETNPTYQKLSVLSTDTYACPRKSSDNLNTVLMTLKPKLFCNACL